MTRITFDNGERTTRILIKDDDRARRQFESWVGDALDMMRNVKSTSVNSIIAEDGLGTVTLKLKKVGPRARGRWLDKEVGIIPLWEIDSI